MVGDVCNVSDNHDDLTIRRGLPPGQLVPAVRPGARELHRAAQHWPLSQDSAGEAGGAGEPHSG